MINWFFKLVLVAFAIAIGYVFFWTLVPLAWILGHYVAALFFLFIGILVETITIHELLSFEDI